MNIENQKVYLTKKQESFKLIIPENVEEKIKCTCLHLPDTEWSGILFYKHKGAFGEENFILTCVNFIILDVGVHARTEFETTPKVATFMATNNLMNCHQGLIHSHNNFNTFFSGTDTTTLKEEGKLTNHFLSLIVNDEGIYSAAITRKLECTGVINYKIETNSFEQKVAYVESKSINKFYNIEYYPIKTIETPYNKIRLNARSELNELIEEKKKITESINPMPSLYGNDVNTNNFYKDYKNGYRVFDDEDSLFDKNM